jgi:hypothetical protein
MDVLRESLPELRYIYRHLKGKKRALYFKTLSNRMTKILHQIAINLLYSHKNGFALNKLQIKKLKPHQKTLEKLTFSKNNREKKKILRKKPFVQVMLQVILQLVVKLKIDQ